MDVGGLQVTIGEKQLLNVLLSIFNSEAFWAKGTLSNVFKH